jgi:glutamate dehydrogenase
VQVRWCCDDYLDGVVALEVIEELCSWARDQLPDDQAVSSQEFIRQLYRWVPDEDLAGRGLGDLFGAALAQWRLARRRGPGETKLRVYNPRSEEDGWASPYTVVEIVGDDMPFTVDSVTMELSRQGFGIELIIHPVLEVRRDREGGLLDVLAPGEHDAESISESVIHAEVAREHDARRLKQLRDGIARVLGDVSSAVEGWEAMRGKALELAEELSDQSPPVDAAEVAESVEFLHWLAADHFTFLGYREYVLVTDAEEPRLRAINGSGLGILRGTPARQFTELSPRALALARGPHLLVLTKANSRATVHRRSYLDYVGVKRFGTDGEVCGERRFLGLYTSAAYKASPRDIPMLRGKVDHVLTRAAFSPDGHDAKALTDILESYPRDALFQTGSDELFEIAIGVLGLGERQRLRLFVRRDQLDRFISCLVCIPRDRFNTQNRERVGEILQEAFGGSHVDWSLQISESVLVRVYYVVHCPQGVPDDYDHAEVERRLVEATRSWTEDLRTALYEEHGEEEGARLRATYGDAFPLAYRAGWSARAAVGDLERLREVERTGEPIISLYRPVEGAGDLMRGKLFSADGVSLSDVVPRFEHMGAKVVDERPYEVKPSGRPPVFIYDFGLRCDVESIERVRTEFEAAFLGVWRGEIEDDGLNELVIAAGLTAREISIVRAVGRYLRQAGNAFSDAYITRTVVGHPDVAALLVELFGARFDPDRRDVVESERLTEDIERAIDLVRSLDEDRILRSFLQVVQAMLRTNYFRTNRDGAPPPHLSFKLDPGGLPLLPEPRPQFEIFVYSPRMEGVHLRGGRVARGGLRWSDRREDFRTEVLGLMKAQMVKNALIVPVGSKGGFVVKRPPSGGREELREEGIACYRSFLHGLLDLTDNISDGKVVPPERVVRYDGDDPYLVVAADKGTASFSDIANEVSAEYGYWLGDAFASGGSHGYDHKQMGITARGAWEAVKRHFRSVGVDIQSADFTVAGIGDMSGDVFGNAMLLSEHTKLVAAFNHQHVFLDPDPDPARSFTERRRLFELPRSSWSDYDGSLISDGGGVYERTAKSIPVSPQSRKTLGITEDELSPDELISAILRAPVDLLFNGGIGTYVRAREESHGDAGDKANDAVRVNGDELRCRVVGEGGNLGITQRGRIEVALRGGPDRAGAMINTDAIDNVAGVNCSDHEVNIKILLDALVRSGTITGDERNRLLTEMTDAVAETVLYGSYTQTQAMSLAVAQAVSMIDVHARLIRRLGQVAGLNREIEFLPSEETIAERKATRRGLLAPELAVVMAYCKIHLYSELLDSDVPEDPYLGHDLERYFPSPLPDRYRAEMHGHRLRREIIATVVANQLVDRAGTTFAFRLAEETGAPYSALARAYAVAREVFEMWSFWAAVEGLDNQIEAGTQLQMLVEGRRLVERAARWLVRANPGSLDIELLVHRYRTGAQLLSDALPDVLSGADRESFDSRLDELIESEVPEQLAARAARMPTLLYTLDIVDVAEMTGCDQELVTATYFGLGSGLALDWLRDRILELPRDDRWEALARAALRDDLYTLHRSLTRAVLESAGENGASAIDSWSERNRPALERCMRVLEDIKASRTYDTTTLPVALREMRNLVRDPTD